MDLRRLQETFGAVLMDGAERAPLEAIVRGDDRGSAAERVAIYADMYRLRLVDVLREVYPRTRALLGEEAFDARAGAYVAAHPSRSPSLRGFGDRMAGFLADEAPGAAALAALEWARYEVFDAVDERALTREDLAALGPEAIAGLPLRLLRAARVLPTTHDVDALYRGEAAGAAAGQVLVWRQDRTVFHRPLDEDEAALLARLVDGTTLGLLCEALAQGRSIEEAAGQVFARVGRWVADGVLAAAG